MPVCNNCNKTFPNFVNIKGKLRNLNKRKYCLTCSPFGLHNTRKFGYIKIAGTYKPCKICNKPFTLKGTVCGSCRSNVKRFEVKKKAIEYKGGKCEACGYDKCQAALIFHHRDPSEKEFGIAGNHSRNFEKLKLELDKCQLLCQNCHAEHHWLEHASARSKVLNKHNKLNLDG